MLLLACQPLAVAAEEISDVNRMAETQSAEGEQETEEEQKEEQKGAAVQPSAVSENQVAAEVAAPHALLMEVSTGTVLMGKAADEKLHPASVTKIMTMLLILEAIEDGKIALSDTVTVSEHAASMGGSQVYLEPFETQTVETMLKCIAVASANDACVAYRDSRQ